MKCGVVWFVLASFASTLFAATNSFVRVDLVSDRNNALITDPSLVNAWGVQSATPSNGFWIANNGSSTATLYLGDVAGSPLTKNALRVDVPSSPAGVVVNSTPAFVVSGAPAVLLFATETGTIRAWQPGLGTASVQVASTANAVYTGLAIGFSGFAAEWCLYTANFRAGTIDVFDATFAPKTLAANFVDPALPAGYAPFNIIQIASVLLVTYAVQDPAKHDPVPGPGNGIVDVFSQDGFFLNRFISNGGALNAPWGMVAPVPSFAGFPSEFLVANTGDGRINDFSAVTGVFFDTLRDPVGNPIVIDGLRGITTGNNTSAGNLDSLYFTAGPNGGANGLFGKLVGVSAGSNTLTGSGATVPMNEGQPATVTVAVFADANGPGTYTASINWGDASTSAGTVVPNGGGSYLVRGTHTYAQASSSNTLTIAVNDTSDGGAATFTGSAVVAAPIPTLSVPMLLALFAALIAIGLRGR